MGSKTPRPSLFRLAASLARSTVMCAPGSPWGTKESTEVGAPSARAQCRYPSPPAPRRILSPHVNRTRQFSYEFLDSSPNAGEMTRLHDWTHGGQFEALFVAIASR